jgi:hypothetical protein
LERPIAHLCRDGGADALRKRALEQGLELEEYDPFLRGPRRGRGNSVDGRPGRMPPPLSRPQSPHCRPRRRSSETRSSSHDN